MTEEIKRNRTPRFLQSSPHERSLSTRPHLPVDDLMDGGTALDTARKLPMHRTKIYKQVKRRIDEMEEFRAFAESKADKALSIEALKDILENKQQAIS